MNKRALSFSFLLFACLLMPFAAAPARAQAAQGTAVEAIRLSAYGMGSWVRSAYSNDKTGWGGAGGVTADFHPSFLGIHPGLDVRFTGNTAKQSTQYSIGGGPRLAMNFRRVQPYADFLVSYGKLNLKQNPDPRYQTDNTIVLTYGGGVAYALNSHWAILGDVQGQRWRLDSRAPYFYPIQVSAGIRYRLRFGGHGLDRY